MKNALRTVCVVALLLLSGRVAGRAETLDFTVVNKTGLEISEIYVAVADTDEWGEDILGQDSLDEGKSAPVHFETKPQTAKYDLKVVDEDGDEVVWKAVGLSKISRVTLHYEGKKPTAEVE